MKQLELFDLGGNEWNEDNWETPNSLAEFVAGLVSDCETVLAPGAGRGQIEKYLSAETIYAVERDRSRHLAGKENVPKAHWIHGDFLNMQPSGFVQGVVCNPPFSLGIQFLARSLTWLNPDFEGAKCVFILPIDFFCSQERARAIINLNCHVHAQYALVGRIAFLRHGIPEGKPQRYHAVFDIRPHQGNSFYNLTWV